VPSERAMIERMTSPDSVPASERLYRMFVKDLVLQCNIGAYAHERLAPQPVRFNVDLHVRESIVPVNDELRNVLSYDEITAAIKAEDVAGICLTDPRVIHVRVCVEKLAVEPDATSVGVEIERRRQRHPAVADLFPLAFDPVPRGSRGRRDGGG
jgi:7,8-dihydroneopterin aldolase/epimerase/oxygenase